MPTNLTPIDSFDELIAVPDEGEEVVAALVGAGKGPVRPADQANANRAAALHALAINQSLVPRFSLSADGVDNRIKIHLPGRVAGLDSNGKRWMIAGTTVPFAIDPTAQVGAPATWPASSIVYVYCYATTTGQLGIEPSTGAPDGGLIFKSGDTSRRYLGCFFTGAGGAPLPIPMSGERGVYRYIAPRVTPALGTDAAYTAVVLTGLLPPHARRALILGIAVCDAAVGATQDVYLKPGPGAAEVIVAQAPRAVAGTTTIRGLVDLPLIDGTLQYRADGTSNQAAGIYVAGWTE